MSLFTELVSGVLGATLQSDQAESKTDSLLTGALGMLENMGGVEGLAKKFQQSGLGDVAASWISQGDNKQIQPEQLLKVLGHEQIDTLSKQAGIPVEQGASVLSQVLPAMVDKLTPDGKAPESNNLATIGKVLLGGLGVAVAAKVAHSYFSDDGDAAPESVPSRQASGSAPAGDGDTAPMTTDAKTYTVASGDTLSHIAKRFYNDANQWQRIYDANRHILNDPNRIQPGQVLNIP